jgi:CPA1 family monovalent cation:H+ antiporter
MLSAAMNQIRNLREKTDPGNESILDDLLHHYQQRLDEANEAGARVTAEYGQHRNFSAQLRAVERSTLLRLREETRINDQVLRTLERELDLLDTRYRSAHP